MEIDKILEHSTDRQRIVNALDSISSLVESYQLEFNLSADRVNEIHESISMLDKKAQDMEEGGTETDKRILYVLGLWLDAVAQRLQKRRFKSFNDSDLSALLNVITTTSDYFDGVSSLQEADVYVETQKVLAYFLDPSDKFLQQSASIQHVINWMRYYADILLEKPRSRNQTNKAVPVDRDSEWIVDLLIEGYDSRKAVYSVSLFMTCMATIPDTNVSLINLNSGCLFARLSIYFIKEESVKLAKALIQSVRKYLEGRAEKEYEEKELKKAERLRLFQQMSAETSKFEKEKKMLELENLRLDIERKAIENQKLALELLLKEKETLAALLAEDIITHDKYRMLINCEAALFFDGERPNKQEMTSSK